MHCVEWLIMSSEKMVKTLMIIYKHLDMNNIEDVAAFDMWSLFINLIN